MGTAPSGLCRVPRNEIRQIPSDLPSSHLGLTSTSNSPFVATCRYLPSTFACTWQIVSRAASTSHVAFFPRATLGKDCIAECPSCKNRLSACFLNVFHLTLQQNRYNSNIPHKFVDSIRITYITTNSQKHHIWSTQASYKVTSRYLARVSPH